jgi:hypothetical protein
VLNTSDGCLLKIELRFGSLSDEVDTTVVAACGLSDHHLPSPPSPNL